MKRLKTFVPLLLLLCLWAPVQAQDLASFEKRVTVKKLPNGLTVIFCRRPDAPVFSFTTFVDSGSSQDPLGKTGLAHMMEHMAFKGFDTVGTKNIAAEKAALARVETAYAAYDAERQKPGGPDKNKLAALEKTWKDAIAEADKFVKVNEFGDIIERQGGVGLNASTDYDETVYVYSMPANRVELWAFLESNRFLHPVMREFYKERDVVIEERRIRTDSSPFGRLSEQFNSMAFDANPYHRPTIGYMSDLQHFSATDALTFFKQNYVPSNLTVALVGDVDPARDFPIVEKYFGRIPAGHPPETYESTQPPQNSERSVLLKDPSQPVYLEGYQRPSYRDPDDAVYDAITDLLSSGRTSRLYRSLVRDKKIALQSGGFSGWPGTKYPHLFIFYAIPLPGHANKEVADAIHVEIDRLRSEDISDDELKMVKTRIRADLIRSLKDNSGLANMLAEAQSRYGDWRELFYSIERVDKVTKADIRRVANAVFVDTNRTVGTIETTKPATAGKGGQQ